MLDHLQLSAHLPNLQGVQMDTDSGSNKIWIHFVNGKITWDQNFFMGQRGCQTFLRSPRVNYAWMPLKSLCRDHFEPFYTVKNWTLYRVDISTLFSKRSAHWFHPVLLVTLGNWPWPRVMTNLSNGLGRSRSLFTFDKIKMTRGRGRWPRDFRKLGWFSFALLLEKSVFLGKWA